MGPNGKRWLDNHPEWVLSRPLAGSSHSWDKAATNGVVAADSQPPADGGAEPAGSWAWPFAAEGGFGGPSATSDNTKLADGTPLQLASGQQLAKGSQSMPEQLLNFGFSIGKHFAKQEARIEELQKTVETLQVSEDSAKPGPLWRLDFRAELSGL